MATFMRRLESSAKGLQLLFSEKTPLDTLKLLQRVQAEPARFRLSPNGSLSVLAEYDTTRQQMEASIAFLDELLADCAAT